MTHHPESEPPQEPGLRPRKVGLYDPRNEHDSCGVGFIAHIKGRRSHQILIDAEEMLRHMDHRGACGSEPNTGDGAGILTALPHRFLQKVAAADLGLELPEAGRFAAGLVFLPTDADERAECKSTVERLIAEQRQRLGGWRSVPVDAKGADLGPTSRGAAPVIEQLFVVASDDLDAADFERQLYLIRKQASQVLRHLSSLRQAEMFYICSLSTKVIVYKGMLSSGQVVPFYPDLADPDFDSHLAMVHSRFSTNTFPMYETAGESGLSSPAVVNDLVFCSTSKIALYAFDAEDGTLRFSDDFGAQTGGFNGGYGYCLGPAISGDFVVVGGLVMGRDGGVLRVFRLNKTP